MTKKVALVEINDCLLNEGQLNWALIAKLKTYDEVVLFTSRNSHSAVVHIPAGYQKPCAKNPAYFIEEALVSTADLLAILAKILKKKPKVSTSMDHFFGKPTEYYDTTLRYFEEELANECREKKGHFEHKNYSARLDLEEEMLRKKRGSARDLAESGGNHPEDKIMQYQLLVAFLPQLFPPLVNCATDNVKIDYFDSNFAAFKAIADHLPANIQKPRCILVAHHKITSLDSLPSSSEFIAPIVPEYQIKKNEIIAKFAYYIYIRQQEMDKHKSEFNSRLAKFFTPTAGNGHFKKNAAQKIITALQNNSKPRLNIEETRASSQGRLGVLMQLLREMDNCSAKGVEKVARSPLSPRG